MKYILALFLVFAFIVVVFYTPVNEERKCYNTSSIRFDQISVNVFNQRLTVDKECSESMDVLYDLELCLQDATKSSTIALYANDMIQRIEGIIRPYAKNLWTLKVDHNRKCENYSWYQLP